MADATIRLEDLWDQRYRDGGGEYVITGVVGGDGAGGDGVAPLEEVPKSAGFTLNVDDNGKRFVATDSLTVTLPAVGDLGNGFEVEVVNDSGTTIIIDGPGATNVTLNYGDVARLLETNGKQRVTVTASTMIGDSFAAPSLWDPLVFGSNFDLTHWWDATRGVTLDAVTGNVTTWTDQVQASPVTQTTAAKQPSWQSSNEIRFDGAGPGLVLATQGRAGYESRWIFLVFRIRWSAFTSATDSFILDINGASGSHGQRVPIINFLHATKQLNGTWFANDGTNKTATVTVPGSDDAWHTLLVRRDEDAIYTSIDGAAEVSLACYPASFLDSGSVPTGFIGNGSTTLPMSFGFDTVLQGQGHLTGSEVAKLHGWGMWRRGAQVSLDAGSPYLVDPPTQTRGEVHVAAPDSYADGYRFPTSGGWDDSHRGDAVSTAGMTRTFHDHFTSLSTITDGVTGAGPWWAPAHIDTSNAKFRRPTQAPLDTYTILPDATTLQIKMQQIGGTGNFYSGHIQSVDSWGNGFLQTCPSGGALYYEARLALNNAAGWPAFWLYSQAQFKDSAATKAEIDILEAYGDNVTSQNQLHITAFTHPAYRPQPGNRGSPGSIPPSRTPSKITNMTQAPFNSPPLFDGTGEGSPGTFHTYGIRIDETWMTWYFDGKQVSRFATYKEALGPIFMLLSLQSQDGTITPQQTYMWVDYVDAYST